MLAQDMQPKWKADTHCIPLSDGVYLRGNRNRLILKGKSLYPLLQRLVPHLDGTVTLEEITGDLDAERKRMVTNLIEKLLTHEFLKDTSREQSEALHPTELAFRAPDMAFIDSLQTSAPARFARFRNLRLLIIGSGSGLAELVQAALQSGLQHISAALTTDVETETRLRQDILELFHPYSSEADACLRVLDPLVWDDEAGLRSAVASCDALLHITEEPMVARAQLLNRLCFEQQKIFLQTLVVGERAWLGPLVCPEAESCWECTWRRLQTNLADQPDQLARYALLERSARSEQYSLTGPRASLLAHRLLFALFQYVTQTALPESAHRISELDLATGLSTGHAVLPHPLCQTCQRPLRLTGEDFLERMRRVQEQSPLEPGRFLDGFASCIDEKVGLFTAVENGQFVQAPLSVYQVKLANPPLKECQSTESSVIVASVDTRDASTRVALQACARYAASCADPRRLFTLTDEAFTAFPMRTSAQLAEQQTAATDDDLWTWALDLRTRQAVLVPTSQVFAAFDQPGRGLAAGLSWDEAICQGLLDWCKDLTTADVRARDRAYPQVDLVSTPLTDVGAYLLRLLQAVGEQITVYDVTSDLGVPTFAICLGERVVAYTTHCDVAQALSLGLEQALQQSQATLYGQADYAPAPVPDLPLNLRGQQLSQPRTTAPEEWSARLSWLLHQLQSQRLEALVVPLDHDPALARVQPFIARVLLSRSESKKGE